MIALPSDIRILSAPDASECVRYAEEELIRWLEKAGISAVSGGSDAPGFSLVLDDTVPGLPGGSFRRTASENRILLEASEGCGVIYGCYDLLESRLRRTRWRKASGRRLLPSAAGRFSGGTPWTGLSLSVCG